MICCCVVKENVMAGDVERLGMSPCYLIPHPPYEKENTARQALKRHAPPARLSFLGRYLGGPDQA